MSGIIGGIDRSGLIGRRAGIKEADQWRLTSSLNIPAAITTNLERVDTVFDKIGTGMTESSGNFTFPSTGIWLIQAQGSWWSSSGTYQYGGLAIRVSTTGSGGTFTNRALNYGGSWGTNAYQATFNSLMLDVTNTINVLVNFNCTSQTSDVRLGGNTDQNHTAFTFIRLGDT